MQVSNDSLWVLEGEESSYWLRRLDGHSGEVLQTVALSGGITTDSKRLLTGKEAVWVICEHVVVHRVGSDGLVGTIEISGRGHLDAAALGDRHVWIATEESLVGLSRTTGEIEQEIPAELVKDIVVYGGLLWIAQRFGPSGTYRTSLQAIRLDGSAHHRLEFDGHPFALCSYENAIYLALRSEDYEHGHLHTVDAQTGKLLCTDRHAGGIDELHPSPQGLLCTHVRDDEDTKGRWLCRFDAEHGLQPLVANVYGIAGDGRWTLIAKSVDDGFVTQWALGRGAPSPNGYQEIYSSPNTLRISGR